MNDKNLITFKDFRQKLRLEIWPHPGEPKSLRVSHDAYFQAVMNDIESNVETRSVHHVDVFPSCSILTRNALSVIAAPADGIIYQLFTISNDNWKDPVFYDHVEHWQVLQRSKLMVPYWTEPTNTGMRSLNMGFKFPESTSDSTYRSRTGWFSVFNNNIWVCPWLQSNEKIVLVWDGPKGEWQDEDILDLNYWGVDYQEAVKLGVQLRHERDFGSDRVRKKDLQKDYDDALADLIIRSKRATRASNEDKVSAINDVRRITSAELTGEAVPAATTLNSTLIVASISDIGGGGANLTAVADLVKSWDDGNMLIVTQGDNRHSADSLYEDVIAAYGDYITDTFNTNKFWPAIGNHDWSGGGKGNLTDFEAAFAAVPDKYYEVANGLLGLYFLDISWGNSQTDWGPTGWVTLDRTKYLAMQKAWIEAKLRLSTSTWKIVLLHRPNKSSLATRQLTPELDDWTFGAWGADLVLAGHSHSYERLSISDTPWIVGPIAGSTIYPREGDLVDDSLVYLEEYGAGRITLTCSQLSYEFINLAGSLEDSLVLTK